MPPLPLTGLTNYEYVDARGSNFNDVRGDQNFHIQVLLSGTDPDQIFDQFNKRLPRPVADVLRSRIANPEDVIQRQSRALECLRHTSGGPNDILLLITDIRSLIGLNRDGSTVSYSYVALDLELQLLHQTLLVAAAGIKAYQYTQLGRSLIELIKPYLERCVDVLQALFGAIDSYKKGLWPTSIWSLWRLVWWNACEWSDLASWRHELCSCRRSLGMFIKALDLIPWTPLGNQLRTGTPYLNDFLTAMKYCPPSLHDVQISKVLVMDHLGESISVPTIFCSSQRNFHYIIDGYCRDRPGSRLVAREDYVVIRADNKRVVTTPEFETVQSGTCLEMSIVLWQRTDSQDKKGRCPRCKFVNSTATAADGWTDWEAVSNCRAHLFLTWGCPARFQVVQTDRTGQGGDPADDQESYDSEDNSEGDDQGPRGGEQESSKGDEEKRDENRRVKKDEDTASGGVEMILPESELGDDDIQFFQRITLFSPANHIQPEYLPLEQALSIGEQLKVNVEKRPPRKKALLVGISYEDQSSPHEELIGSAKDVRAMRKVLIEIFNYDPKDIVTMLESSKNPGLIPTRAHILKEIDRLVSDVREGDHLYFHYAGHSTQMTDGEDVMNEAIVPVDDINYEKSIIDDDLRRHLVDPVPVGARLFAVFDTCHSESLLDLPHIHCNQVYVPWSSKGVRRRDSSTRPMPITVRAPILSFKKTRRAPIPSKAETSDFTSFYADSPNPTSPIQRTWSPDPINPYECHGFCEQTPDHSEMPYVVALGVSKDYQQFWDDELVRGMTQLLVQILKENRNRSLKEVLTELSHRSYNNLKSIRHSAAREVKRRKRKGLTGMFRGGGTEESEGPPANQDAVTEDTETSSIIPNSALEDADDLQLLLYNVQEPQLSSNRRLDLDALFWL